MQLQNNEGGVEGENRRLKLWYWKGKIWSGPESKFF
jgi:hypothetical protein